MKMFRRVEYYFSSFEVMASVTGTISAVSRLWRLSPELRLADYEVVAPVTEIGSAVSRLWRLSPELRLAKMFRRVEYYFSSFEVMASVTGTEVGRL
jgi:hypothetical protein